MKSRGFASRFEYFYSGFHTESKFCRTQQSEVAQNRRRRDLRWVFSMSAQPLLHFQSDPNRLHSNASLRRKACHKPLGDPFLGRAQHALPRRFCAVPRYFAIHCKTPLHYAKLRLRHFATCCEIPPLRMTLEGYSAGVIREDHFLQSIFTFSQKRVILLN